MDRLEIAAEEIRAKLDVQTTARDKALSVSRTLIQHCSKAIRAVHRDDDAGVKEHLKESAALAKALKDDLVDHPDLFFTGYTQDALKEYVEAEVTCALIKNKPLVMPAELDVPHATYLKGLSEVVGELRRRTLDELRHGYSQETERLLGHMDEIYAILVTMDYPDAITHGLRRQTDIARSIIERTRGDITFSLRGEHLEKKIDQLSAQLGISKEEK
ncbi:MAG: haloacid dehalogenase [Anaerolineae bacterium]|jgi:translin|nr:haloacid dehalogenase [Anaerolineae bacterium]MBT7069496.1 haloacid dehalogenase [Anaerolineae bacterium]MBT7324884.1 haloacid dehalogenase [Anaerolineae bacterium]